MVNKHILIGNLGADPEIRYLPDGKPVATLSLATTETWKKKDGSKHEQTEWHRLVAFGPLAVICQDHLTKGSKIYVEGRVGHRKWQDKEGVDRYTTEVVMREMKMLTPKGQGGQAPAAPANQGGEQPPLPTEPMMGDDVPF